MTGIIHSDHLSLHTLITTVQEQQQILNDPNETLDHYEAAYEVLGDVSRFLSDLGRDLLHAVPEHSMSRVFLDDWIDDLLDHLEAITQQMPDVISEDIFDEVMQQLVTAEYESINTLPEFVVIDWTRTIQNMKRDYAEAVLDDRSYYVRLD